ncbi:hypothetical protein SISNIDRAFT_469264 [Sistotremastrum niveocremeum HHB9708]|uniref:F-box domain-containing protein n=1 Tax=Sistotremastrum niveocremeum HHB9708 TaxID=1314777 RepID=A0A164QAX2_9AGAM|nr:hypothetical protein SISNIDRAFT_469264 [Sistotremastrum niveocremeum HHB9708]
MSVDPATVNSRVLWSEIESSAAKEIQSQLVGHRQSKAKVEDVEQGGLSDELILEILHYIIHKDDKDFLHGRNKNTVHPAVSLCARWRRIAVNAPSLWTTIRLPSNSKLFRLFRDRSEALPLTVYLSSRELDPDQSVEDELGDPLRQLLPRIARLYVHWIYPDLQSFFSKHIGETELSSLVSLDVEEYGMPLTPQYMLRAPRLRQFRFMGPLDNIILVPFHYLVDFKIHCFQLTPGEILDILSLLPRVKFCAIGNIDPSEIPTEDITGRVVVLNNLQTLSIGALTIPEMASLVKYLQIPASATMSLKTEREGSGDNTIEDFVGPLLEQTHELSISHRGWMDGIVFTLKGNKRAKTDITHSSSDEDIPKFPSLANLAVYPTPLHSLTLHLSTLPETTLLIEALRSWKQLSHVGVCTEERQFEKLLIALEATPGTLCPKLQNLNCTGTKFSSTRMKYFLQMRKDHGVPLQELKFTKGFAEPNANSFSSLVPTIIEFDPALSKCGFAHPRMPLQSWDLRPMLYVLDTCSTCVWRDLIYRIGLKRNAHFIVPQDRIEMFVPESMSLR